MFTHSGRDLAILARMTDEEKRERLSSLKIKERVCIIKEYKHWILAESEFPYIDVDEHLILWCKRTHHYPHPLASSEMLKIIEERPQYIHIHKPEKEWYMRFHLHFIKLNTDVTSRTNPPNI